MKRASARGYDVRDDDDLLGTVVNLGRDSDI